MKTRLIAAASLLAMCSLSAHAKIVTDADGHKMDCTTERVTTTTQDEGHPVLGTLAGAAAGGVVGHQFGGGRGQDVATAAGAVGSAAAGHELTKAKTVRHTRTERHCRQID